MKWVLRSTLVISLVITLMPMASALEENLVYLLPDATDRYRPALETSSGVRVLANIDSITPPAMSPDGTRIAFSGSIGDESLGRFAIYLVSSSGSGLTQLTSGSLGEFDPSWSTDGTRIAIAQNTNGGLNPSSCCRLATVNVSTGQLTPLTNNAGVARPSYSQQGSFILFDTPAGVWRIGPSGGNATLIASAGFDATSSPGEDRVAYLTKSGGGTQIRTVG